MPLGAPPVGNQHLLRNALALTALVLAILLILAAIYFVVPRPFFFALPTESCVPSTVTLPLAGGSQVTFQWNANAGRTALLTVTSPGGGSLYSANASTGAGQFTASATGSFVFGATACQNTTVLVQGSYVPSI